MYLSTESLKTSFHQLFLIKFVYFSILYHNNSNSGKITFSLDCFEIFSLVLITFIFRQMVSTFFEPESDNQATSSYNFSQNLVLYLAKCFLNDPPFPLPLQVDALPSTSVSLLWGWLLFFRCSEESFDTGRSSTFTRGSKNLVFEWQQLQDSYFSKKNYGCNLTVHR